MTFSFDRWSVHGETFLALNLNALLQDGVVALVFSDPASFSGSITLMFRDGDELELNFNDVHGRQQVAPSAEPWHELEAQAARDGEYKLNEEFWRAHEYLSTRGVPEGEQN